MNDHEKLLEKIREQPESVTFQEVMAVIDQFYDYTPTRFTNGNTDTIVNERSENEGSCKIFSFARLNQLTESQTLQCFGDYYRDDVLQHPEASDHANIRTFIKSGWQGIRFESEALVLK